MGRTSLRTAAALTGLLALLGACGSDDPPATTAAPKPTEAAGPGLAIASPARGATLTGNVATLDLEATGIAIVKADGDTSGRTGHYHVFVDREPVAPGQPIPREAGVVHSADDPVVIPGLSAGPHRFTVVLGDGAHMRTGTAQADTTVTVQGPSIDATAPATSPAGQPVRVSVKAVGIALVKADGDTSGRTGHLHLFVDRPPTPAGQPIPVEPGIVHTAETEVDVAGLAPGEHTIWVVAGDGTHTPLAAGVMDKVTVTVG